MVTKEGVSSSGSRVAARRHNTQSIGHDSSTVPAEAAGRLCQAPQATHHQDVCPRQGADDEALQLDRPLL